MMELYQAMVQAGAEVQVKTNRKVQQTRFVGAQLMMPRMSSTGRSILYGATYQANGRNGCRIYYDDGWVEEIPARLDYVLNSLAQLVHINLKAMQEQSRQWLARAAAALCAAGGERILYFAAGGQPQAAAQG